MFWLGCREKSCCHNTKVIISGRDMWRISETLELMPWYFTRYTEAVEGAPDGFQLEAGGQLYQVVLAKQGEVGPRGAPCVFLWKLADGHAQCGLGGLRPLPCLVYPSMLVDGLLQVESGACTCRRWTLADVEQEQEESLLAQMLDEATEYSDVVAGWNAQLEAGKPARTFTDFCKYILGEYRGPEKEHEGGQEDG